MTRQNSPRQNYLLDALPPAEYERLFLHLERVPMMLGEVLYESGGELLYVYFPTSCIISMLYVMENGASAEIALIGNEGILGIALFMGGGTMPNRAIVQSAGFAYRLKPNLFKQEFNRYGVLHHLLLRYTQALITQMTQTAVCNRHHSVDQQLCRWLLLNLDRLPANDLTMTQELIANMLGVRREGVTETAGNLQRAGLIHYSRGHITVLNRPGLESRVCECYQVVKTEFERLLPFPYGFEKLSNITKPEGKFSELRKRAENIKHFSQLVSSETFSIPDSNHEILSVFHELDTYRIELELQNDELLNTQKKLQDIYQNYFDLYDFAPVAYLTLDDNGLILKANNTLATLIGLTKQHTLNQLFTNYVLEEDQDIFYFYRQALLDHQNPKASELRLRNKNGQIVWVKCEGFFKNMLTEPEINLVMTDITELRNAMNALCQSEKRHHLSLIYGGIGMWEADLINNRQIWSENCSRLLGFPSVENPTWVDFITAVHPEDRSGVLNAYYSQIGYNIPYDVEYRITREDGHVCWMRSVGKIERDAAGEPILMLGIVHDITERKQTEIELRIAATAFESQEGMFVTDSNNVILRVNQAFTRITGYPPEQVIGKNPRILSSALQSKDFYTAMRETILLTGGWEGEIYNRRKNGEIYPLHLTITAVKDQHNIVTNYVAAFNDTTLSRAALDEIERLAFYDPLTDLPNRRLLLDRLKLALVSSYRCARKGALLFIDMDDFKTLNDTLGHDIGDVLLQQTAERLITCVREGDTVARLGGDEFVVMLEDLSEDTCEAAAQAEIIGNKILASINQPYQLTTHDYHCTSSIGATLFNGHEQSVDNLVKHADIAMYQAKAGGRNALRFFDPQMQACLTARVALEADLRLALAENQLKLYFQPQVQHNRQIIGAEVLLRWHHPHRLIFPADFIPLAEDTGLIVSIGQWILEAACAQLKIWEGNSRTQHLRLAVNVSAKQFRQADFVEQVYRILSLSAINPDRLKLELTETLLLDDIEDSIIKMKQLRDLGVRFAIDDFGTGYSSLSYLTQLPLDQLKIDKSFVCKIGVNPTDAVIVQTIIGMAKNLGMEVIAEGVETEAQRLFLEQHDCPYFQGYLFSKLLPIEQFEALL